MANAPAGAPPAAPSGSVWQLSPDGTYVTRPGYANENEWRATGKPGGPWTDPATGATYPQSTVYPDGSRIASDANGRGSTYVNPDGTTVKTTATVDSTLGGFVKTKLGDAVGAVKAAYDAGKPANVDTSPLVTAVDRSGATQDRYRSMQDPTRATTLFNEGQTLIGNLGAAAAGAVPSAAEIQARRQVDQAANQQFGTASNFAGRNPGGALRMATVGASNLVGKAIGDNAALRAKEQADARGQLVTAVGNQQQANNAQQGDLIRADLTGGGQFNDAASTLVTGNAKNTAAQNSYKGAAIGGATTPVKNPYDDKGGGWQ